MQEDRDIIFEKYKMTQKAVKATKEEAQAATQEVKEDAQLDKAKVQAWKLHFTQLVNRAIEDEYIIDF